MATGNPKKDFLPQVTKTRRFATRPYASFAKLKLFFDAQVAEAAEKKIVVFLIRDHPCLSVVQNPDSAAGDVKAFLKRNLTTDGRGWSRIRQAARRLFLASLQRTPALVNPGDLPAPKNFHIVFARIHKCGFIFIKYLKRPKTFTFWTPYRGRCFLSSCGNSHLQKQQVRIASTIIQGFGAPSSRNR
jgi:hypothetical protein